MHENSFKIFYYTVTVISKKFICVGLMENLTKKINLLKLILFILTNIQIQSAIKFNNSHN